MECKETRLGLEHQLGCAKINGNIWQGGFRLGSKKTDFIKACLLAVAGMACLFVFCACKSQSPVDVSPTPSQGAALGNANELIAFFESGSEATARLTGPINLGERMVTLDAERGPITLIGEGFEVKGSGDSVIRVGAGASLRLEDVTITGDQVGVGLLDGSHLEGSATIVGGTNAIQCVGAFSFGVQSAYVANGGTGSGIFALAFTLEKDAEVTATGDLHAALATQGDVTLESGSSLTVRGSDYNVLKCAGTLVMKSASELNATNTGSYHGAEIGKIQVEGVVTIHAKGGSKGVGLFVMEQQEQIKVQGSCDPAQRFDSGDGGIEFVDVLNQE